MSIKSDKWIKKMSLNNDMISPFEDKQISQQKISYGLSSYGYDIRVTDEYKIFTNIKGNVIADPGRIKSTKKIIAHVSIINDTRWKLKNNQRVHLHIGTTEVVAKAIISDGPITKGQSGNVLFILEKEVAAIMDQRFIIRSFSPMETIGGCVVLDINPIPTKKELRKWINNLELNPSSRFKQFVSFFWKNPKSIARWGNYFQTNESEIDKWIIKEAMQHQNKLVFNQKEFERSIELVDKLMQKFHNVEQYCEFERMICFKKPFIIFIRF